MSYFRSPKPSRQNMHFECGLALRWLLLAVSSWCASAAPAQSQPRWLVSFESRSFDLAELRRAIVDERDATAARALIAEFERRAIADHADFVAAAERHGARVLRHWWIVNGCHLEAPREVAHELARSPGVARVEPDAMAYGASNRPHDHFNHGTEFAHGVGIDGRSIAPSVLAIMDSGVDENMAGLGRPHRTFFPDGDPANPTGGGIGGSRLLFNTQFGALGPDDPQGHGHSVAAIAAGDRWGTAESTPGHAKGAQLASYCILDSYDEFSVGALYSTMTSAWQQMLVDRVTYNIVVANNSFGGEQDPLHFVQQALDNAAWLGDILVCVSAGNSGPGAATGQQSAVNGLAVAAASADSHEILDTSSRGPVALDPTRTYPDITAIGMARVPPIDCEVTEGLFSLTSSAAARVAGGAMILRAAAPSLSAEATKAILLASAMDISDANPGLDENAFGVGLMREDRALLTTADLARHARFTLTAVGQTSNLGVGFTPGQRASIAIAWMRPQSTITNWSDLDLSVIDGATQNVLATSSSPRNLYEKVTFTAPPSGLVVARVTAMSLSNGSQDFAIAAADLPAAEPSRGSFATVAAGCEGPQLNANPYCTTVNPDVDGDDFDGVVFSSRFENVIQFRAPAAGMVLTGFELFLRGSDDAPLDAHVFLDTSADFPRQAQVRSSTMPIDVDARWYRTTFAPLTLGPSQRYWVGVSNWNQTNVTLLSSSAPTDLLVRARERCAPTLAWTHVMDNPRPRIGVRVLCDGPPRAEVPLHVTAGNIRIGEWCALQLDRASPLTATIGAIGFSMSSWPGGSLPFDLSPLGGTGCMLHVDPAITVSTTTNASGEASVPMLIAPDPAIVGWTFFSQFLLLDPTSSRAMTTSNAGRNTIGTR